MCGTPTPTCCRVFGPGVADSFPQLGRVCWRASACWRSTDDAFLPPCPAPAPVLAAAPAANASLWLQAIAQQAESHLNYSTSAGAVSYFALPCGAVGASPQLAARAGGADTVVRLSRRSSHPLAGSAAAPAGAGRAALPDGAVSRDADAARSARRRRREEGGRPAASHEALAAQVARFGRRLALAGDPCSSGSSDDEGAGGTPPGETATSAAPLPLPPAASATGQVDVFVGAAGAEQPLTVVRVSLPPSAPTRTRYAGPPGCARLPSVVYAAGVEGATEAAAKLFGLEPAEGQAAPSARAAGAAASPAAS